MRPPPVPIFVLHGEPHDLGRQHGAALRQQIHANVGTLLGEFVDGRQSPARAAKIAAWQRRLREFCFDHWPWLQPEIHGIAEGADLDHGLAELLSFRAWQYDIYHDGACSSFAVAGEDGRIVTGGTLDDPHWLYAAVQCQPAQGLRYLSFPIAGTVWANRGMNEAGLALGISSLICPGVRFDLDQLVPVDLVFRDMLQFCSTVADIEERCRRVKFFCNLIAVDRHGGVFSSSNYCGNYASHSIDGGAAALTNHPIGVAAASLAARGYTGPESGSYSVERLDQIYTWHEQQKDRATIASAAEFLGAPARFGSVNNPNTAFATIAAPQADPHTLWLAQQPVTSAGFHPFDVRTGSRPTDRSGDR